MPRQLISQTILELLASHHFLTAPQLLDQLHTSGKPVNKTTVYRSLERLENDQLICKHNLVNNELAYELREHHHDHLVCSSCHKVQTTECQITIPQELSNFKISHHHLTLYGLCSECQSHV